MKGNSEGFTGWLQKRFRKSCKYFLSPATANRVTEHFLLCHFWITEKIASVNIAPCNYAAQINIFHLVLVGWKQNRALTHLDGLVGVFLPSGSLSCKACLGVEERRGMPSHPCGNIWVNDSWAGDNATSLEQVIQLVTSNTRASVCRGGIGLKMSANTHNRDRTPATTFLNHSVTNGQTDGRLQGKSSDIRTDPSTYL